MTTATRRAPPMLPGGLPALGHALALRRDPVGLLLDGHARFGEVFSLRLPRARATALIGPRAQAAFFGATEDHLSARHVYQFTVPIFGRGVVYDTTPAVMDEQMGFLFPALRDARLRVYARIMQDEAERYVAAWGEEGEIDLLTALNELTVFIASRCLVGAEFRSRLSRDLAHLFHDLERGINLVAMVNPYLPLPAFRRRDRARARMAALITRVIAERRAGADAGEDFLEVLMGARYADGRALSDDEIVGMLISTIFAGQHTSTVMGAWTGILLLEHSSWLPGVLDELASELGDGEITLEALRRLVVLERCIKEAERMHPPLIILMRRIVRDFEYDGWTLPAGELAMVAPAAAHRLRDVFADPDRYDPDRFAPPREEDRRTTHGLIGFGGGHHRCIGTTFAQQQIKVIWSVILRRFDVSLAHTGHRPDYTTFVVGPRPPCTMRYRRRRVPVPAASPVLADGPSHRREV